MTTQTPVTHKAPRDRSPSYPALDLEKALARTRELLDRERRHLIPLPVAIQHWGYTVKSSGGKLTLAALKKFGLLEEQGRGNARQVRVSSLAVKILMDERPDSVERAEAIKEAALNPSIHAELWTKYGQTIPSDAALRHYLVVERGFNQTAVTDFIEEYKRTVDYAKLGESDTLPEEDPQVPPKRSDSPMTAPATAASVPTVPAVSVLAQADAALNAVVLPLSATSRAILQAPFPLTEGTWKQMLAVLNAMKPALVAEPEPRTDPESG